MMRKKEIKGMNLDFDKINSDFIDNASFYFGKNNIDSKYIATSFLIDNMHLFSKMSLGDLDAYRDTNNLEELINEFSEEKGSFIKSCFNDFYSELESTRLKLSKEYILPASKVNNVKDMFLGLKYERNNNAEYKNCPSALSLATFTI